MSLVQNITNKSVKHVDIVLIEESKGLVRAVYEQMDKEFRVVPPMSVHSQVPNILAAVWSASRETLVVGDNRIEKEFIATKVSELNDCPFCVDVHSVMLKAGGMDSSAATSENFLQLCGWASATLSPGSEILKNPPFAKGLIPSYLGTAVVFHYINRVVNVFMKEGSPLNMGGQSAFSRHLLKNLAARTVGSSLLSVEANAGESLKFLEDRQDSPKIPSKIPWIANGGPTGIALSKFFAVLEAEVAGVFKSQDSQSIIAKSLQSWHGEQPSLGRGWIAKIVEEIPSADRDAATLALLVARSSYQITDEDVKAFRRISVTDQDLIKIVAWGAGLAAQKIATWIDPTYEVNQ